MNRLQDFIGRPILPYISTIHRKVKTNEMLNSVRNKIVKRRKANKVSRCSRRKNR